VTEQKTRRGLRRIKTLIFGTKYVKIGWRKQLWRAGKLRDAPSSSVVFTYDVNVAANRALKAAIFWNELALSPAVAAAVVMSAHI